MIPCARCNRPHPSGACASDLAGLGAHASGASVAPRGAGVAAPCHRMLVAVPAEHTEKLRQFVAALGGEVVG